MKLRFSPIKFMEGSYIFVHCYNTKTTHSQHDTTKNWNFWKNFPKNELHTQLKRVAFSNFD